MRTLFWTALLGIITAWPIAEAQLMASPSFVNFGQVPVETMAPAHSVFVSSRSTEEVRLTITNWSCTQDFQIWPAGCYSPLPPNGNCIFLVNFRPTRVGFHSCVVNVRDQRGTTATVTVSGTGG